MRWETNLGSVLSMSSLEPKKLEATGWLLSLGGCENNGRAKRKEVGVALVKRQFLGKAFFLKLCCADRLQAQRFVLALS
jgi:hypothetical protein